MKCVLGACLLISITVWTVSADTWNYHNISEWPETCQTGIKQSPIDLVDSAVIATIFSAFTFTNYGIFSYATVSNNGHSVAITLNTSTPPTLSGGGLQGYYVFDHFHFHWESEHTINGERFPLEMHLVHYSTDYSSLNEAAANAGGVAVLGVFFKRTVDDDDDFIPLVEVIEKVYKYPNTQVNLERTIAAKSFLPRNTADYYRYTGSLTTPDCNEGVIWIVFTETLPISSDQLVHFEGLWATTGPLLLNYRPIQPLNGRAISLRNIPPVSKNSNVAVNNSATLAMLLFSILPFVISKL